MNRWWVYEWLKKCYMATGQVPSMAEIFEEFKGMDFEEILEGIEEFRCVCRVIPAGFDIKTAV